MYDDETDTILIRGFVKRIQRDMSSAVINQLDFDLNIPIIIIIKRKNNNNKKKKKLEQGVCLVNKRF